MASPRLVFTGPDGSCFVRLLSQQPTFEKVQGWVHRKLRLAEGEGFDAAFACDLLDGTGEREVMLDDDEDLDALAHLVQHGFFATDTVHVAIRVVPAPAPHPSSYTPPTGEAFEDVVGIPSNEDFQRLLQMIAFPPPPPPPTETADQAGSMSAWEQAVEEVVQPDVTAPSQESDDSVDEPAERIEEKQNDEDEEEDDDDDDDFTVVVESASASASLPPFTVSAPAPVPQPAAIVVVKVPETAAPAQSTAAVAPTMVRSASSSLSPTAAVFNPSSTAIPSIAIEAASSLASSTSSSSSSAIAEPATPPSPLVALLPAPAPIATATVTGSSSSRPKTAGLAILARRLPSPILANFPADVLAPATVAAVNNPANKAAEGGQHSFRPSSPTLRAGPAAVVGDRQAVAAAVDAPSATQEADDFLSSRSFQELRWADDVDSPPRARLVPGFSSPVHAAPRATAGEPVVVGGLARHEAARSAYSHLSVDAAGGIAALAEARQRKAQAALDHLPALADGRAPPDASDALALAPERSEVDLEEIRQSHYRRQQSPPQNRGASSSSMSSSSAASTRRFVSSSSAATSHPSPTSSNAPSTPGDHEPTPAGRFSSQQQPFTPPPAKPIFTGCDYGRSPSSPEQQQAVVNLVFSTTAAMPEFGSAPADPKPNKRIRVRASKDNDDASAQLAAAPAALVPEPAPLRSVTPTGVEYTSLRALFPSLFIGKPPPGPIARPQPVQSWLAKELAPAYMREGKCFRCSAVGHVKAACPY